ncbi:MAG: hypothetical protein J4N83_06860, partial [Chloroflexi bacterium]|nr:hypothetical protein [Chloroflexota bacterium]
VGPGLIAEALTIVTGSMGATVGGGVGVAVGRGVGVSGIAVSGAVAATAVGEGGGGSTTLSVGVREPDEQPATVTAAAKTNRLNHVRRGIAVSVCIGRSGATTFSAPSEGYVPVRGMDWSRWLPAQRSNGGDRRRLLKRRPSRR